MCGLLREYRERAGLTQDELADLTAGTDRPFHKSQIGKIERGERRLDVFEMAALCAALNVSLPKFWDELQQRAAN